MEGGRFPPSALFSATSIVDRLVGVDPPFAPIGSRSGNPIGGVFDGRPDLRCAASLGVQKPGQSRHVGRCHRGAGQAGIAAAPVGGPQGAVPAATPGA